MRRQVNHIVSLDALLADKFACEPLKKKHPKLEATDGRKELSSRTPTQCMTVQKLLEQQNADSL